MNDEVEGWYRFVENDTLDETAAEGNTRHHA